MFHRQVTPEKKHIASIRYWWAFFGARDSQHDEIYCINMYQHVDADEHVSSCLIVQHVQDVTPSRMDHSFVLGTG